MGLTVAILWRQHALGPMIISFQWASQHYQRANAVPYGFEAATPQAAPEPFLHSLLIQIPSALPLAALGLLFLLLRKRIEISGDIKLLLAAGVGAVLACYPRWAANQLLFTGPVFLCLIAQMLSKLASPKQLRLGAAGLLAASLVTVVTLCAGKPADALVKTELGTVSCSPHHQPKLHIPTAPIKPGETLFVYPYQPIWYSLTGAINPTGYDFLQPGMMTLEDESKVLGQLEKQPPQWILWHTLPPRTVLAFWPNSDRATLRFARIEKFIRTHYARVAPPNPTVLYAIAIFGGLPPSS